jgi:hypothetical protein
MVIFSFSQKVGFRFLPNLLFCKFQKSNWNKSFQNKVSNKFSQTLSHESKTIVSAKTKDRKLVLNSMYSLHFCKNSVHMYVWRCVRWNDDLNIVCKEWRSKGGGGISVYCTCTMYIFMFNIWLCLWPVLHAAGLLAKWRNLQHCMHVQKS